LFAFSHPDYTVGPEITTGHASQKRAARGLYRRSGIEYTHLRLLSPCPEDSSVFSCTVSSYQIIQKDATSEKNHGQQSIHEPFTFFSIFPETLEH
jgi:hypothetical protein